MKRNEYWCDICDDGPHRDHMVVGLYVIEDIGCMGPCEVEKADKHICRDCAAHVAKGLKALKRKTS